MMLHLDRLALRLDGLSEADGRRLVELVGAHLANASPPAGAETTRALRVSVSAAPGEALDTLAQRIVTALLGSLARTS